MTVTVPKIINYNRTIQCMPDKSMSIRAVLFNAFATGKAKIKNLLLSDDVLSCIDCVKRLGASVVLDGNTATVCGAPFHSAELDCGNSGTTARLIMGLLAGLHGKFVITGDESLRSRPMLRVIEPLRAMGANIEDTNGRLPVTVRGSYLKAIDYEMTVASAQVKSALILAGINACGGIRIHEKVISRNHTEKMLRDMNAYIKKDGDTIDVKQSLIYCKDFSVPGDISSAAYPLCLALASGGKCTVKNVGINATRTGLLDVFNEMGAHVEYSDVSSSAEPVCDITVNGGKLKPFHIGGALIPRLIDEIPVLCALACFADGDSVVSDASELRFKETDRIATTIEALSALGADIESRSDGMVIHGGKPLHFGTVDPKLDHRIAMSAAVLGAAGEGVKIKDAECASVSYPHFYDEVIGV